MRKILIIDDQPIMCNHLAEILRTKYGMEVIIRNTYTNMNQILQSGCDAVVLDVMMPYDKDYFADVDICDEFPEFSTGKYLFKKIRREYPQLPVIFHTALREQIECDGRSIIINKPNLAVKVAKSICDFIKRCEEIE